MGRSLAMMEANASTSSKKEPPAHGTLDAASRGLDEALEDSNPPSMCVTRGRVLARRSVRSARVTVSGVRPVRAASILERT